MMTKMIMMTAALWCEDAGADPGFFSRGGAPRRNDLNLVSYVVVVDFFFFLQNTTYFRELQVILGGGGGGVGTPCTGPQDHPCDNDRCQWQCYW